MAKVYMIRHGSTNLNHPDKDKDRIRGWLDISLNIEGLDDAIKAADEMKDVPYEVMYVSDLKRTIQTALVVNKSHDKPMHLSSSLRPWNLGIYQGAISSQVHPMLKYYEINENLLPKDGESFKEFRLRLLSFVDEVIRLAKEKDLTIVLVSHFRDLQTVNAWVKNGKPADYTIDIKEMQNDSFKPGDLFEIDLS